MTSPSKPVTAFGFAIIPVSEYQDLVSSNQVKSDRVDELAEANTRLRDRIKMIAEDRDLTAANLYSARERIKSLEHEVKSSESTRIRNVAQIQGLRVQIERLEESSNSLKGNETRYLSEIEELKSQVNLLEQGDRACSELLDEVKDKNLELTQNLLQAQKELATLQEAYRKALAANSALDLKLGEAIAELSKTEQICNEQTVQIATLKRSKSTLLEEFANHKQAVNIELDNHKIAVLKTLKELDSVLRNTSVEGD